MKKILGVLLALLAVSIMVTQVRAAGEVPSGEEQSDFTLVATVNIQNAQIINQNGNRFTIGFELTNGEMVQPGVRYAVQLATTGDDSAVIDQKIYDEVLDLKQNDRSYREVEYIAPDYTKGSYGLWIVAENQSAMKLGIFDLGTRQLSGNGEYLQVDPKSCYLTVEEDDKKFTVDQGVDVRLNEKLIGHCQVKNHFSTEKKAVTSYVTHDRSLFGRIVEEKSGQEMSFKAGEGREMSFPISVQPRPQAYDVEVKLFDQDSKKSLSNSVVFHYVVQGGSGTIQNLRLNKDEYAADEMITGFVFWSPSADMFPESRGGGTDMAEYKVDIEIKDGQGKACAKKLTQPLSLEMIQAEFQVKADKECQDPKVVATLSAGKLPLDMKDFSFKSKNHGENQIVPKEKVKRLSSLHIFGLIVAVIVLAALIFVFWKKHAPGAGTNNLGLMLFLLAGGLLVNIGSASAYTYATGSGIFVININKTNFAPGENVVLSGAYAQTYCDNTPRPGACYWHIDGRASCMSGSGATQWFMRGRTTSSTRTAPMYGGPHSVNVLVVTGGGGAWVNWNAPICSLNWIDNTSLSRVNPRTNVGRIPINVVGCTETVWNPNPNTVCSGQSFVQTSNCGTTRNAIGTMSCCAVSSWAPDPNTVCSGQSFVQTSNCGTTRNAIGTMNCCGNGVLNPGEQCDAGASNGVCPSVCSTLCTTNNCGAPLTNCDRCSTWRQFARASFQSLDPTCVSVQPPGNPVSLTCDCSCPGNLTPNPPDTTWSDPVTGDSWATCSPTCSAPTICGNGVVEGTEECDFGAANGACPSTCDNTCHDQSCATCGNGILEGTEQCDFGINNGACPSLCTAMCQDQSCCAPDPSCQATTCVGNTCSDACGNVYNGTKACAYPGDYEEVR